MYMLFLKYGSRSASTRLQFVPFEVTIEHGCDEINNYEHMDRITRHYNLKMEDEWNRTALQHVPRLVHYEKADHSWKLFHWLEQFKEVNRSLKSSNSIMTALEQSGEVCNLEIENDV